MGNRRLTKTDSQDPLLESFYDDVLESGHGDEIDNRERGCGHLKHRSAYVRSDVEALSVAGGELPRFVVLDRPIEYREHAGRGAIIPGLKPFPGVEFSLAYLNSGYETDPEGELEAHMERLRSDRLDGGHYGEIVPARANDLLMSVGKTHWPTPMDYITECRKRGLNLKIPAGPGQDPPIINPLRTRCWVVHPRGYYDTDRAAIIGYAYLTRTIFTTGEEATESDPDIPEYARDWADTGLVDLVTPGKEVAATDEDEDETTADITSFGAKAEAEEVEAAADE